MDLWTNVTEGIASRLHGPLKFRLIVQPTMALVIAIRAGLKDAREGRPVFFWAALTHKAERGAMLRDTWKHISRLFVIAVAMDLIYQLVVHARFSLLDSLFVAALLAVVPYVIARGMANRIARRVETGNRPPR